MMVCRVVLPRYVLRSMVNADGSPTSLGTFSGGDVLEKNEGPSGLASY